MLVQGEEKMGQTVSFILMGGLGLVLIILAVLQKNKAKKAAETWPRTNGVVEKSELSVRRDTDSDGSSSTTYAAHVVYRYQVGGMDFSNNAIGFGSSSGGRKKAKKKLLEYPVGKSLVVYYHPDDPSKAVIEPVATSFGVLLAGGILLIISAVVMGILLG
jgi:hypothetical protein